MAKHRGRGFATINYPIGMNLGGDPSSQASGAFQSDRMASLPSRCRRSTSVRAMKSVTRQIAAETLGVPVEDVYVDYGGQRYRAALHG